MKIFWDESGNLIKKLFLASYPLTGFLGGEFLQCCLISGVHYCRLMVSLISILLSVTSFQNLKTPHLKSFPMLFLVWHWSHLCSFLPFFFFAYILLVVLVFTFHLHFNWDISFESLGLSVLCCLAHNIQQRNQSHQFFPLRIDMVEVLYGKGRLLVQK